ncbi:YqkE family protein [Paenibacillus sp. GCM10023252]|uniref:YqkE family protein n=1 Tax=Paenibacillus sp. GCM10023252 TaxID=3252649 RepID=UPI00361906F5
MGKKQVKPRQPVRTSSSAGRAAGTDSGGDKPATLKDLLSADVLGKLKAQADDMKAAEARAKEEQRQREEDAKRAEQKRRENDFAYLLDNSSQDWGKYK